MRRVDSGNRKDIERAEGGSCRTGIYSTGATHTRSDSGNLQKTVVGCRSFILRPHLSFTFNSGGPKGWIPLHGRSHAELGGGCALGLQGGIQALLTDVPSSLQRTWCRP